jgi:hypothetical protein
VLEVFGRRGRIACTVHFGVRRMLLARLHQEVARLQRRVALPSEVTGSDVT